MEESIVKAIMSVDRDTIAVAREYTRLIVNQLRKEAPAMIQVFQETSDRYSPNPKFTGKMRSSWAVPVRFKDRKALIMRIKNSAPYSGIVDGGSGMLTRTAAELLPWAQFVIAKNPEAFEEFRSKKGRVNTTNRGFALLFASKVSKKLARVGIEPRHIVRDSLPQVIEIIRESVHKASREFHKNRLST